MNLEIDGVKITGRDREIEETLAAGGVAKVQAIEAGWKVTPLHDGLSIVHPGEAAKLGDVDVVIVQAAIRADRSVSYEVAWWDGKTRHSAWVTETELSAANVKRLPVGFREVAA